MKELLLAAALALGCALSWPAQAQIPGGGCNPATSTQIGCSRPDNSTITINNGVLSTTAGGGNVNGPASSTVGFIPQWNNTSGTLLGAGLPVGTTGNSTVIETSAGGLLSATILPIATTGAFGAVKPDGTTITISAGVISAVGGGAVSLTAGNAGIVLSPSTITGTGTISLGNPSASTLGGIESFASVAHQWINAISTSGVPSATQPAFSDLSGSATLAQLPSLNADTFYCNPTGSGAAPQDCGLGSGLVFAGTNLDPAAPVTPHTATGNISTLAGLDIFNCTAACTATLATMAANQSLMVSTYNATNSPTLGMNGQTLVGCPSTDATTIHQFGFYIFAFDATNTQVDGACFPGFGTITANVLMKYLDGTGAPTTSALSDNGTVVSTTEPIDLTSQPLVIEIANASSTGTTVNKLAKLTGAPATAVLAATTDTDNMVGIVSGGAGTTGNAQIAVSGQVSCVFDGATTAGDYVVISSSTAGDCHDSGASRPTASQAIGRVLSTNGSGGTFSVALAIGFANSSGSGSLSVTDGTHTVTGTTQITFSGATVSGSTPNATVTISGGGTTAAVQPQGRLTLVTLTPVLNTDQINKSQIFYDCFNGPSVPYWTGSAVAIDTIGSCEVSTTMATSGTGVTNSGGVFDVVWVHSATTICVITNGSGGGWASDTGGSNTARGTGYSQVHNTKGMWTNVNSVSDCFNGTTNECASACAADTLTYLGSFTTTAAGQTGMQFTPAAASGGPNAFLGLWNAYNRVPVSCTAADSTGSWSYTSATWRAADGSNSNRVTFVDGLQQSSIQAFYQVAVSLTGATDRGDYGVDYDSTSATAGGAHVGFNSNSITTSGGWPNEADSTPLLGLHFAQAVESVGAGTTVTFVGGAGATQLVVKLSM